MTPSLLPRSSAGIWLRLQTPPVARGVNPSPGFAHLAAGRCFLPTCSVDIYQIKRHLCWTLVQMLMDVVWIGVMGAGTRAKAVPFMYGKVAPPTASLRHDGVLLTPPVSSVGRRSCQLCGSGRRPLPGVERFQEEKCSRLRSAGAGHASECRVVLVHPPRALFITPQLGHIRGRRGY